MRIFFCDVELSDLKMEKKIRNGHLAQYNFIFVVGAQEEICKHVNVRTRDNCRHGSFPISQIKKLLEELVKRFEKDESKALKSLSFTEMPNAERSEPSRSQA